MTTPNGLVVDAEYLEEIEGASGELRALILTKFCAPLMLSLAWHDAGTFDVKTKTGGPNGSIRNELNHAANRGLKIAVEYCGKIKAKHPKVTYADLYQLAGVAAIEVSRGPKIDFAPGRMDCLDSADEIRLPDPKQDLREIYYRMGLSDKDIVALSGAHTLGRTHIERSDSEGTCTLERVRLFNNSYFVELLNGEKSGFLQLPTDKVLVQDPVFRPYVELYAKDKEVFFKDYAASHKKLSELGFPPQLAVTPPESGPSGLKTAMTVTGNVFRLGRDILSYMYDVHKASKASKKAKSKTTNTSLDIL